MTALPDHTTQDGTTYKTKIDNALATLLEDDGNGGYQWDDSGSGIPGTLKLAGSLDAQNGGTLDGTFSVGTGPSDWPVISSTVPGFMIQDTSTNADESYWSINSDFGSLRIRAYSDDFSSWENALVFSRSGATISQSLFQNGVVQIDDTTAGSASGGALNIPNGGVRIEGTSYFGSMATFSRAPASPQAAGARFASTGGGGFGMADTNAATDQKQWLQWIDSDGSWRIRAYNDDNTPGEQLLEATRSGATITTLTLGNGRFLIDDTTDATSTTDGSLQTDGGLSVAKAGFFGTSLEIGPGSNSDRARVGGVLFTDTTAVGNVGSGEDDLMSYNLPGGTLANDGESLEIEGSFEGNGADAVTLKFYFGSDVITIHSGSSLAATARHSFIDVYIKIIRLGGSSEGIYGMSIENSAGGTLAYLGDSASETLSTNTTIKFTGENTNDTSNDAVVQKSMIVKFRPAGP